MTLSFVEEASAAFFLDFDLAVVEPSLQSRIWLWQPVNVAGSSLKHSSYVGMAILLQAAEGDNGPAAQNSQSTRLIFQGNSWQPLTDARRRQKMGC